MFELTIPGIWDRLFEHFGQSVLFHTLRVSLHPDDVEIPAEHQEFGEVHSLINLPDLLEGWVVTELDLLFAVVHEELLEIIPDGL